MGELRWLKTDTDLVLGEFLEERLEQVEWQLPPPRTQLTPSLWAL